MKRNLNLEVAAEGGKVVLEDGVLRFTRNETPTSEFSRTFQEKFGKPLSREIDFPIKTKATRHVGILQNFTNAILKGEPLLAPAAEGIHSVELANAMLYSTFTGSMVELPLDGAAYEKILKEKASASAARK